MQNPLDRVLYHRLAAGIARSLVRTPVTPNMVSVAGGAAIVAAGLLYTRLDWPVSAMLGLLAHMSWHVLDGADGDLARLTGRTSTLGEVVDGLSDYLGHVVLYLLLGAFAYPTFGPLAWFLAVGAGFSRIIQANFYEVQRRQFLHWAYGVGWLRTSGTGGPAWLRGIRAVYLGGAEILAPRYPQIDGALDDPRRGEALRQRLQALGPRPLTGGTLLGANYRTLALGLSMFAGSPVWFFLYEATILNLVLIIAAWRARKTLGELAGGLQSQPNTSR